MAPSPTSGDRPRRGPSGRPGVRRPRRRGIIVALEGPSGVGKSTVARHLAARLGAAPLGEAWERLRPTPSLRYRSRAELLTLERRLLAEEGRRFQLARHQARRGRAVVVDTGFLGPLTYSAGLARMSRALDVVRPLVNDAVGLLAAGRLSAADVTFYLDASPPTLGGRQAGSRETHPDDLARRHWRVADVERGLYTAAMGARIVYAEAPAPTVAAAIARAIPTRTVPDLLAGTADPSLRRALELVALLVAPVAA